MYQNHYSFVDCIHFFFLVLKKKQKKTHTHVPHFLEWSVNIVIHAGEQGTIDMNSVHKRS